MYEGLTLAHNIGTENHSNYHTREQILNCKQPIGFDGIYKNVYDNMDVLEGKSGILFVMGNYVGKDNSFDLQYVPKLEQYCTWEEINEILHKYPNFELGWHTYSHPDLTKLRWDEMVMEIMPPFPIKYFAYPYGLYNDEVVEVVKQCGYEYAWSVTQGCTDINVADYKYKIYRDYIK
jgi:hypothetical protein